MCPFHVLSFWHVRSDAISLDITLLLSFAFSFNTSVCIVICLSLIQVGLLGLDNGLADHSVSLVKCKKNSDEQGEQNKFLVFHYLH